MPMPAAEPAKPIRTVRKKGIGSGPGIARRARAPIRKPAATPETIAPNTARRLASPLDGQALEIARVVGEDLDSVLGDDHGVGVAEAADVARVDAGLDGEDHAGLDQRVVADVEERRLVVAQADRMAG